MSKVNLQGRGILWRPPEQLVKGKGKVRTLDIAPLRESSPQKRSGTARVLKGSHSFTCTSTRSPAIGIVIQTRHVFLSNHRQYSLRPSTERRPSVVGLGGWLHRQMVYLQSPIPLLTALNVEQLR